MLELTITEAHAIKNDVQHIESLKQHMRIRERGDRTEWNESRIDDIKKDIDLLEKKIKVKASLSSCQSLDDINEAICYAINKDESIKARHITVDDLPKESRETRFPKKQTPATLAKKAARFINRMRASGSQYRGANGRSMQDLKWNAKQRRYNKIPRLDSITHIESGRVWDASTRATAEEFMETMSKP